MTTGQRLRQAREAQNVTIDDVARRTNIRPRFLQAIEDDDLATIPASHQRLFVREFAKVVGIDPAEALADLPEVSPAIVAPEAATRETAPFRSEASESDRREYREILARLSNSSGRLAAVTRNPAFMLIGAATVLLLTVAIYYFVIGDESATAQTASAPIDTAAATEILSGDVGATPAAAVDAEASEESGDSLTLEGRAMAKVWYTIVMDGKRSETGTLDSGAVKTWRAFEVFKVSLGNAGGLQLLLNERALGTLGPAQSVVRSKYIDREGVRTGAVRKPAATSAPSASAAPASPASATSGTVAAGGAAPAVKPSTAKPSRAASSRPERRRPRSTRVAERPKPMKEILTTEMR